MFDIISQLYRLPEEVLYIIFKYVPRGYVPDVLWRQPYFVTMWTRLHIVVKTSDDNLLRHVITYEDDDCVREQVFSKLETDYLLTRDVNLRQGQRHGLFRLWTVTSQSLDDQWHHVRRLSFSSNYVRGELYGEKRSYFSNGQLASVSHYVKDELHGPFSSWYFDYHRRPHVCCCYSRGRYHGEFREFDRQGELVKHYHYQHDRLRRRLAIPSTPTDESIGHSVSHSANYLASQKVGQKTSRQKQSNKTKSGGSTSSSSTTTSTTTTSSNTNVNSRRSIVVTRRIQPSRRCKRS